MQAALCLLVFSIINLLICNHNDYNILSVLDYIRVSHPDMFLPDIFYFVVFKLDSDHKGSLFNLALLYRNHLGKPDDARNLALHLIKVNLDLYLLVLCTENHSVNVNYWSD